MIDDSHGWPFTVYAASDRGSIRDHNEDYYGVFDPETRELRESRGVLVVVTDGMGGHFFGGEASRMVVEVMGEIYYESAAGPAVGALERAFREANRRVFTLVGNGRDGAAGTTCTAIALFRDRFHIAHAGDSRAYRARGSSLEQLTVDHSVVGELVEKGLIDREDAVKHPRRNVLTRAVGLRSDVTPDIREDVRFGRGDSILLCTDGLFSMVPEGEILEMVQGADPEKACKELVELAKKNGGEDNVTAIVIRKT